MGELVAILAGMITILGAYFAIMQYFFYHTLNMFEKRIEEKIDSKIDSKIEAQTIFLNLFEKRIGEKIDTKIGYLCEKIDKAIQDQDEARKRTDYLYSKLNDLYEMHLKEQKDFYSNQAIEREKFYSSLSRV